MTNIALAARLDAYRPIALALLRIVAGLLLLHHGTAKLFGFPHVAMFDGLRLVSLMGAAGILECVGGVLLVLGLLVRPAAFILSGEMAVAYFMMHAPQGFFPALNGGEAAILFCFICLYLVFAGGGARSLDGWFAARKIRI